MPFLLAGVIAAVFLAFWLQPPSTVEEASASKKTPRGTPDGASNKVDGKEKRAEGRRE
jgi:hypothetical protein